MAGWRPSPRTTGAPGCCRLAGLMSEALGADARARRHGAAMSSGWASAAPPGCLRAAHKDNEHRSATRGGFVGRGVCT